MQALVQQATPPNPNQVVFAFRECAPAGRRGFPQTISAPGKPPLPTQAKGYHPHRPPQKEMAVTQPTSRGWECPPDALTQANVEGCVDIAKPPGRSNHAAMHGCTRNLFDGRTSQRSSHRGTSTVRWCTSPAWDSRRNWSNQARSDSRSNAGGLA